MKKEIEYKYYGVPVITLLAAIDGPNSCYLKVGHSREPAGLCENFRFSDEGLKCDIRSMVDLKGLYPILTAEGSPGGSGRLLGLTASPDKLNADETLKPFI